MSRLLWTNSIYISIWQRSIVRMKTTYILLLSKEHLFLNYMFYQTIEQEASTDSEMVNICSPDITKCKIWNAKGESKSIGSQ
jgi:hypothetical protein